MAERNTRIRASQIRSILPDDLEATNALVDNYVPSYDQATGKFTWVVQGAGGGDMLKATYDTDDDGIVDKAENLNDGSSGGGNNVTAAEAKNAVDKAHDRLHDIDSTSDHNGVDGATENNFVAFDANGLPKDSGHKDSDYADASHTHVEANITDLDKYTQTEVDNLTGIDDFTIKRVSNQLKIADRIELNIMLNAFRIAINGSLSQFNMTDGITDEYEDESGVDTVNSLNETYDSTNDLYYPFSVSETEIDYMEYATDGAAQAAYVSSGGLSEYSSDANTKLLLHLNNNVTDSGNTGHTVTNNSVTFSDSVKKLGSHSAIFNGSSSYLSIPDHADWDVFASNSDNWTIELWVKHDDHSGYEEYVGQAQDGLNFWSFMHRDGYGLKLRVVYDNTLLFDLEGGEITDTDWHHVALCKVGNEYGLYLDGQQTAYVQDNDTMTLAGNLTIGKDTAGYGYFDGYMDEIRIIKDNPFSASPNSGKTDTITLPSETLQCYSEASIKNQGSYSLKTIAAQTGSLNDTLTKSGLSIDLTDIDELKFDVYASRTGTNLQMQIQEASVISTNYETGQDDLYTLYGGSGTWEEIGQEFQVTENITCNKVSLYLKKKGSPTDNVTCRIETDNSGVPSGTLVNVNATKTLAMSSIDSSFSYVEFEFDTSFSLSSSTVYHIVITRSGSRDEANSVDWGMDVDGATYSYGESEIKSSGTWSSISGRCQLFRVYKEGATSTKDIVISSANTWTEITWDISGIADANKDNIDSIIIKVTNADSANTFYVDNFRVPGSTNNMTLISDTFVAEATPSDARIVLFEEDVDAITVNTDIKAYVSRDGGSTYGEVTLSDEGDYESGKRILTGIVDLTQSGIGSGTNMEYKITTHNNKSLKLHGTALHWD